ncbi:MAG: pyridoxamine kinase [Spirochaetia bacterium]|nr:pyridoxamine kinase [Spirochaetia bacterium]
MKTVAAMHDLSCYAKSSLTVVIPTLSMMGLEVSPLPTALLSTQTDGFPNFFYTDLIDELSLIIAHWKTLNLTFDAIYSGFLGSERCVSTLLDLITWQRKDHPLVVIDPVLGDSGSLYDPITHHLVEDMKKLISFADVVTPNITEAALLLDEEYNTNLSVKEASSWAKRISELGPAYVVITSIMEKNNSLVVSYDKIKDTFAHFSQQHIPVSYPGCGDLFASILTGRLLQGADFSSAVADAAYLVKKAVEYSHQREVPPRHGVSPESIAYELVMISH